MRVSLIMSTRESTSSVVIFAERTCPQTCPRISQVAVKGRWIQVVIAHWKHCNSLRRPHSMDRHLLQEVNDKVRKDHRFHEFLAQPPNREHDSSSVHRRLQYEVGLQTCGKLAALKIPMKESLILKE